MTPRLNTLRIASPLRRLGALSSVLLIGAAIAAFSASALAGGHRSGHYSGQSGEACGYEGYAQHRMGGAMGGERQLDRLLGDVKLTDAQRTQIRDIQSKARLDLKALHTSDRSAMPHGMSLLTQAKPDAAAAEKARQDMLARHDKASQRMLQAQLDVANVLTPAQRAQLATTMKARQERMAERRAAHQAKRAASQPAAASSAPL